jgi:pathogenesis-related protein 1
MMKKNILSIGLCVCTFGINVSAEGINKAEMVNAHNKWRSEVGVPNVVWSDTVANVAQHWANQLKSEGCTMRHSSRTQRQGYGENLYWASALRWSNGLREVQNVSSKKAVDSWGSEKADYNYSNNSCNSGAVCGHYTQVVWNTTTKIGCGMAICNDKTQIWVCNYDPTGNYIGVKPY